MVGRTFLAKLLAANVPAANVMDIRSFAAVAKSSGASRRSQRHQELLRGDKGGAPLGRAKVYLLAANVYPQDELRGARKVELLRGNKVVGALVAPFPLHVE